MVDEAEKRRVRAAARLKAAREAAGFATAQKAAKRFGWVYRTYLTHENPTKSGRGFNNYAKEYAEAFGTTAAFLLAEDDEVISEIPNRTVPIMSMATAEELIEIAEGKKPKSNKRLAVGQGIGLSELAFAWTVTGDAMTSTREVISFADGDDVVIDPKSKIEAGCFVLAVVRGERLFRRYKPAVHGSDEVFSLIALNDFYPTIQTSKDEGSRIIGRAVRMVREL